MRPHRQPRRPWQAMAPLLALAAALLALSPTPSLADDIDYLAEDVTVTVPAQAVTPVDADGTYEMRAQSSPVGQWVEFQRSEASNLVQTSDYFISPTANADGSVSVTTRTTMYNKGPHVIFWTTTKTLYDNGRECSTIPEDWDTRCPVGHSVSQETTFSVYGGGTHHITSTERLFRLDAPTVAGWDFYVNIPFRITATAGTGGTISPSGHSLVNVGSSQPYSISADGGYRILDVKIDGQSHGPASTYTFSNVSADHTIQATFQKTWVVTFVDGVTGETVHTQVVDNGTGATRPQEPAHDGWRFDGWDKDFSHVTQDMTVTAIYTKLHTVTFKDWDGTELDKQVVPNGNSARTPDEPKREGWTFVDWDTPFEKVERDTIITATYDPIIAVRVPTVLPCKIMADGTVATPSDYAIENLSVVNVRSSSITTTGMPSDASYELSCNGSTIHGWKGEDKSAGSVHIEAQGSTGIAVSISPVEGDGEWRELAQRAAAGPQDLCTITYTFEWAK